MRRPTEHGLSFLDLMTCGLGGMLLLFFIVLTVHRAVTLAGSGTDRPNPAPVRSAAPFVIVAHAASDEPLFAQEPKESPWELRPAVPEFRYTWYGSSDFAVLYSDAPPPVGTTIALRQLGDTSRFTAQVFSGGRRVFCELLTFEEGADSCSVWPLKSKEEQ